MNTRQGNQISRELVASIATAVSVQSVLIQLVIVCLFTLPLPASADGAAPDRWDVLFEDATSLLGERGQVGDFGPLWAELNNDGWLDLIFMNHGFNPSLFVNEGGQRFVDKLRESGIQHSGWLYPQQADRHGGSCADYDNDGDVDLFFAHGAKLGETLGAKFDQLLNNDGQGSFREVSHAAGTLNAQGRARLGSWGDYDGDGNLDLYIGNFATPNVLYRNNGDGTFADTTEKAGLALVEPTRQSWFDYDKDGLLDLLLIWPLKVYRNSGDGTFVETTHELRLDREPIGVPYGFALADYDNDGDVDLFVVSRHHRSTLFRNESKTFSPLGGEFSPAADEEGTGAAWGDFDNDGDLDLVVASSKRLRFFENIGKGEMLERTVDLGAKIVLGEASDVALGDFDNDGRLDLAVNGTGRHYLLRNATKGGSWLKVTFVGHASNRMGIGAKVWIYRNTKGKASDLLSYHEYTGETGHFRSSGCGPLHVGLGKESSVQIRVLWPSGQESLLESVAANQIVRIEEPQTKPASGAHLE